MMLENVNHEIVADLGSFWICLEKLGFEIRGNRYEPTDFGNYYVDFESPTRKFRIVRDRSQYMVDADQAELERVGLWQAFDNREDFFKRITDWLKA